MPLILPGNVASATAAVGYSIDNSCRFNRGDSADLQKTWSGTPTDQKKYTFSFWVKRCGTGTIDWIMSGDWNPGSAMVFNGSDQFEWSEYSGGYPYRILTNRKFRDPSAWYHFCCRYDSTDGTAGDRQRLYINGVEETSFSAETNPALNYDSLLNTAVLHSIASQQAEGEANFTDLYLSDVVFIDGSSLAPTSFGEFDEDSPTIWKPIDVSGLTFGTNGFYLDFEASDNLGNDANGGTDWTEANLDATDQATDTPTNNFATFNSLSKIDAGAIAFSEGNLYGAHSGTDSKYSSYSTIGVASGKWYGEFKFAASSGGVDFNVGVGYDVEDANRQGQPFGFTAGSYGYNSYYIWNDNEVDEDWGDTLAVGDIVGVALDLDNHKLYFSKNGTFQDSGDPTSGATGTGAAFSLTTGETYVMGASHITGTDRTTDYAGNYGGCPAFAISSGNADGNGYGNFEYAVPSSYFSLCTKNLAEFG